MTGKHILLVTHDVILQASRLALLVREGYDVDPVQSDGEALTQLRDHHYDLIVIGRDAQDVETPLDERIARAGVGVPVLKISDSNSAYAHAVGTEPKVVLSEVRQVLSGTRCSATRHARC